jgi:CubicO group peptidase (beta-lactamase class C family)
LGVNTDGALEPVLGDDHIDPAVIENDQVAPVAWPVDPQGYQYGADLLRLPARDLAKLGFLYLNGGRWDGAEVIPAAYVANSISGAGSSPNALSGYGWLWWVGVDADHNSFRAQGFGGQYIHVVPDLDLVTIITSDPEAGGLDPRVSLLPTIIRSVTG